MFQLHIRSFFGAMLACTALSAWGVDLLAAYRGALENDPNFRVARNTLTAVQENIPQARAELLPSIDASSRRTSNETISRQQQSGVTSVRSLSYPSDSWVVQLRQPLYSRLSWTNLSFAEAQVAAAEATFEKERQDTGVRVSEAYFNVLLGQSQVRVLQAQIEAFRAQLALAERALPAGEGTRTDIDDARARLLQSQAALIDANNNLSNQRRALGSLLGKAPGDLADVVPERLKLAPPQPAVLDQWLAKMEEKNPELVSLRNQVEVAKRDIARQRAGHHPTLDFIAARVHGSNETNVNINSSYYTSYYGLQATVPLYRGGGVSSAVRQAEANHSKARAQFDATRERVALELQKSFSGIAQGVEKVRAMEAALQAAELSIESSRNGVRAGTRTVVDVLNALQRAAESRQALNQARYEFLYNKIRLAAAAGELNDDLLVSLNTALAK